MLTFRGYVGFYKLLRFVWCSGSLLAYANLLSVAAVYYFPDEGPADYPPSLVFAIVAIAPPPDREASMNDVSPDEEENNNKSIIVVSS